jgi:hypothetical protein
MGREFCPNGMFFGPCMPPPCETTLQRVGPAARTYTPQQGFYLQAVGVAT